MWPKALKVCVCCTPREEKKPSPKAEAPSKGSGSLRTDSRWDPKHSTCCHQQPWPLAVGLREQGSLLQSLCGMCQACVGGSGYPKGVPNVAKSICIGNSVVPSLSDDWVSHMSLRHSFPAC